MVALSGVCQEENAQVDVAPYLHMRSQQTLPVQWVQS